MKHVVTPLTLLALAAAAPAQGVLRTWPVPAGSDARAVPAGDVDLDGVPDVAVAETVGAGGFGIVRVYSGAGSTELWSASGATSGDRFGSALIGLGDVDGDGRGDVAAAGLATFAGALPYVRVLSGADGSTLWEVAATETNLRLGAALARLGDVDGDGAAELVVGAPRSLFTDPGEVYVLSGATGAALLTLVGEPGQPAFGVAVAGARDMTGDGVPDVLVGDDVSGRVRGCSGADGSTFLVLTGPADSGFGRALAAVPDADNDGVGDVLVGAPGETIVSGQTWGRAHLHSGAGGELLHTIHPEPTLTSFGQAVFAFDDLDGDGVSDHLVSAGAYKIGCCTYFTAEARVYSGATGALLLHGEPGQATLLATFPDANGDGTADWLFKQVSSVAPGRVALALAGLPNPQMLCGPMTTAQGCQPWVTTSGTPSLTLGDGLRLDAVHVPAGTVGLFAWSRGFAMTPFGETGLLCLAAPIHRFPVVGATAGEPACPGGVGPTGTLSFVIDRTLLASLGVAPGESFHVQGWLRDPDAAPSDANVLTGSIQVSVWP